jgi:hypothetical protein
MLTLAITLQAVLLVYHQATTLFDFFPFNGVRANTPRERRIEAAVNFVFMAFPLFAFVLRKPSLMEAGVICNFIVLGAEFATWWIPYFFGPSPKWLEIYSRVQGPTITVLPRRGTSPVPNLEHLILMVLTLLAAVGTLAAFRATPGASFHHVWRSWAGGAAVFGAGVYQCCLMGRGKAKAQLT